MQQLQLFEPTESLGWGDIAVAIGLPIGSMVCCMLYALRNFWGSSRYSRLLKIWIALLFCWVVYTAFLAFWYGLLACQGTLPSPSHLHVMFRRIIIKSHFSLARLEELMEPWRRPFSRNIFETLGFLPEAGRYALWPERAWFGNRRMVVRDFRFRCSSLPIYPIQR